MNIIFHNNCFTASLLTAHYLLFLLTTPATRRRRKATSTARKKAESRERSRNAENEGSFRNAGSSEFSWHHLGEGQLCLDSGKSTTFEAKQSNKSMQCEGERLHFEKSHFTIILLKVQKLKSPRIKL